MAFYRALRYSLTSRKVQNQDFHKSHPIPFAIRKQVEQAIHKEVSDGELELVYRSDWTAPIVVATKKDGGIHICADFKMTINPH